MSNAETFNATVAILEKSAPSIAPIIVAKRENILTGFGAVKTAEKAVKGGVSFGSASASKAAQWAKIDARTASVFASAWALAVAIDAAGK